MTYLTTFHKLSTVGITYEASLNVIYVPETAWY